MRKSFQVVVVSSLALFAVACQESAARLTAPDDGAALAAIPAESGNKLQCFQGTGDGYGSNGTCTLSNNGAVIDNNDGDADPNNNYGGVYVANSNLDGKLLSTVNKLSFSYSGPATGGSPRISLPIDVDGDGTMDGYLFIDSNGCNDGSASVGTLDAVNDATCTMYLYGSIPFANLAELIVAYPQARVAAGSLPFIIADQPGLYTITNVQLGRAAAKAK
jgi:hypothetical protein